MYIADDELVVRICSLSRLDVRFIKLNAFYNSSGLLSVLKGPAKRL